MDDVLFWSAWAALGLVSVFFAQFLRELDRWITWKGHVLYGKPFDWYRTVQWFCAPTLNQLFLAIVITALGPCIGAAALAGLAFVCTCESVSWLFTQRGDRVLWDICRRKD